MEKQLRTLMFIFRQHSEAALFASDLKHSIALHTSDDTFANFKIHNAQPLGASAKPDEALNILNLKLS
jgi:hypothetical protein